MFSNVKSAALVAMLLLGSTVADAQFDGNVRRALLRASPQRALLHLDEHGFPVEDPVLHGLSQAAQVVGAVSGAAGLATGAYGLATGDKNAEQIGLGEMGLGSVTGVGGGLAAVGTRCHWAMGDHVFKHSRC